eukprot:1898713-Prymnesium_polylepis.2
MPGALLQNSTFAGSIICVIVAGSVQSRAEEELIAIAPEKYPPRTSKYLLSAWHKWRHGEEQGTLLQVIRKEFAELREVRQDLEFVHREKHYNLTGIVEVLPPKAKKPRRLNRVFTVVANQLSSISDTLRRTSVSTVLRLTVDRTSVSSVPHVPASASSSIRSSHLSNDGNSVSARPLSQASIPEEAEPEQISVAAGVSLRL